MLESFVELYRKTPKIYELKKLDDVDYRAFSLLKGSPPSIVSVKDHIQHIPFDNPHIEFIKSSKTFWLIPLQSVQDLCIGFMIKSYRVKRAYRLLSEPCILPPVYGWSQFKDFRNGDPVIITEGIKDVAFIQQYYPFTLGVLSASIPQSILELLKIITDKVIIAFDNDLAGKRQSENIKKELLKSHIKCVSVFPILKDYGDYIENGLYTEYSVSEIEKHLRMFGQYIRIP